MVDGHPWRPFSSGGIFFRLVGHYCNFLGAFPMYLQRDLRHREWPIDMLPAGHCNRIVVEDLECDIHARSGSSAHCKKSGVVVGSITDVLEHVRRLDERCFTNPARTFSAHLGIAGGT